MHPGAAPYVDTLKRTPHRQVGDLPHLVLRAIAALSVFAVLWFFTPAAEPRFRLCGFYWLTGHPCPFCGLTRATFALAKGHFAEAEHFNALAPLGLAMIFSLFWSGRTAGWIWTAGIAAFAVYGVCRFFVTQ